jgi:predicted NAD/FAD-binding protein
LSDLRRAANFINFLNKVGVETEPTDMTFGVSRDQGLFEWAGNSLGAIFCQRRNIFSPKMWRMVFDIIRFNQFALDLLMQDEDEPLTNGRGVATKLNPTETIGEYMDREGYSDAFKNDYLLPMTAAVWRTSPDKCSLQFPAVTLVRFM